MSNGFFRNEQKDEKAAEIEKKAFIKLFLFLWKAFGAFEKEESCDVANIAASAF